MKVAEDVSEYINILGEIVTEHGVDPGDVGLRADDAESILDAEVVE